jgi:transcriptional regulator with XRE-family HTH domain
MALDNAAEETSPILLRLRLAKELRRHRVAAAMTLGQVADALECSASKLSRIEQGKVGVSRADVEAMSRVYGVSAEEREALLALTRRTRRRRDLTKGAPDVQTLRSTEALAQRIRMYNPVAIPGLFQVEEYVRSMISVVLPNLDADERRRQVVLRLERQDLLRAEDRPTLHVILDEAALRRIEGTPDVLGKQLHRLMETSELEKVTLQIIPFSVGLYGGLTGAFRIFTFPDPEDDEFVHIEGLSDESYLRRPDHVAKYSALFQELCRVALTPQESAAFLRAIELGSRPSP